MEEYISRLSLYKKPDLLNVKELTSAEHYYDPHAHLSTHEQLVSDNTIVSTFEGWIKENELFIKNKIVLDVGCGTGLFSLFAAQAGAAHVIALEWSHIAEHAKKIVANSRFGNKITVVKGNVEDVVLPVTQVDTIISQWIGYSLLLGGRVKKVLVARDRWLKPNGVIIPDCAQLYISAIADVEYYENVIEKWNHMYGYNMSSVVENFLSKGQIVDVPLEKIITNKCCVKNINLRTDSMEEIKQEVPFSLEAIKSDFCQGYCTFFNVNFSLDLKQRTISTDPRVAYNYKEPGTDMTHFRQTCFYFRNYFMIRKKEKINGSFSLFGINNDPRFLGVIIGTCFQGELDEAMMVKTYVLRS